MIDDIIAKWYAEDSWAPLDIELKVGMWEGKLFYTIPWENQGILHFNVLREVEAIARINGYQVLCSSKGIEIRPSDD